MLFELHFMCSCQNTYMKYVIKLFWLEIVKKGNRPVALMVARLLWNKYILKLLLTCILHTSILVFLNDLFFNQILFGNLKNVHLWRKIKWEQEILGSMSDDIFLICTIQFHDRRINLSVNVQIPSCVCLIVWT